MILCNKLLEQKSKHNKLSFCWNVPKIRDSYGPFFRRNYCECYKLKRFTIILNTMKTGKKINDANYEKVVKMDREYDPGKRDNEAILKKKTHYIFQALLLVIIRFCQIYLLRYWPLFWVYLSTANWICLPCVFFSPAAIKISCVHSSWRFCLRKKSVANARRNDELSFPLPHTLSWHFLEFFFVSPSSKKNR